MYINFTHRFPSRGRWDVNTPIHKVWGVNGHDNIEESGPIIGVQIDHYKDFAPHCLSDTSANDPLYGSTGNVKSASHTFYNVLPTQVGVWTCLCEGTRPPSWK